MCCSGTNDGLFGVGLALESSFCYLLIIQVRAFPLPSLNLSFHISEMELISLTLQSLIMCATWPTSELFSSSPGKPIHLLYYWSE